MAAIKFEKSFVDPGGCTQNEANAFSLWNNNLGYQGILESEYSNDNKSLVRVPLQ
jgi:hypothetical protein